MKRKEKKMIKKMKEKEKEKNNLPIDLINLPKSKEPNNKIPCDLIYEKKFFIVKGNTKDIKEELKKIKGKWNPTFKGWTFKHKKLDDVIELLTSNNYEIIEKYSDDLKDNNALFYNAKKIKNN